MTYNNKEVIVSVIYRSPSQNNSEIGTFLSSFEKLLSNINKRKLFWSVITGDFNTRSSSWWPKDIDTTEGSKFSSLTSSNGFPEIINETTHIQTSSSSCIDLIFTHQSNLSVDPGVHASLHPNFNYQIIHPSLILIFLTPYRIKGLYGIIKWLIQKILKKPMFQ